MSTNNIYKPLQYSYLLVFEKPFKLKKWINFAENNGYNNDIDNISKNKFTKNDDIFIIPKHIFSSDIIKGDILIKELIYLTKQHTYEYPNTKELKRIDSIFNRKTINIKLELGFFDKFKSPDMGRIY